MKHYSLKVERMEYFKLKLLVNVLGNWIIILVDCYKIKSFDLQAMFLEIIVNVYGSCLSGIN